MNTCGIEKWLKYIIFKHTTLSFQQKWEATKTWKSELSGEITAINREK
jgi:hypothetical protein